MTRIHAALLGAQPAGRFFFVELTVKNIYVNYLNYYYVEQGEFDPLNSSNCILNAIITLRAVVNSDSDSIIEMPLKDVQAPWDANIDENGQCLLQEFKEKLSGGDGGPLGTSNIRTGPERAIIFINMSEIGIQDGTMQNVQEVREFNGHEWIPFTGN